MPRMPVDQLVALDEEEQQEAFVWIDWRSDEDEVVTGFAEQLDDPGALTFRRDGGRVIPILDGVEQPVPLTMSGSDRYVMIHSLAEMLKDRYTLWMHVDGLGSDTHGFLILRNDEADELRRRHPGWVKKYLMALTPGVDGFSGLDIPWWGHEDHAPDFGRKRQAIDAGVDRQKARVRAMAEAWGQDLPGDVARGNGFLSLMGRQQMGMLAYAVGAVLAGLATLSDAVPAGVATHTVALAAAAFLLAAIYHGWVFSRLRWGWRPPMLARIAPALVIMGLLVLAPMLLPSR